MLMEFLIIMMLVNKQFLVIVSVFPWFYIVYVLLDKPYGAKDKPDSPAVFSTGDLDSRVFRTPQLLVYPPPVHVFEFFVPNLRRKRDRPRGHSIKETPIATSGVLAITNPGEDAASYLSLSTSQAPFVLIN